MRDQRIKQPESPAQESYRLSLRWRERWTFLIFIVGVAATSFLVLAIFLFIKESWLPGALSTLASIITGAPVKWLVERRNEAVSEEKRGYDQVRNDAKDDEDRQKGQESRNALMGRKNM